MSNIVALRKICERLPENGVYDGNFLKFTEFTESFKRESSLTPTSQVIGDANRIITELYNNDPRVNWMVTFASSQDFRSQEYKFLEDELKISNKVNFSHRIEKFVSSMANQKLALNYELDIPRDHRLQIKITTVHKNMQHISPGVHYKSLKRIMHAYGKDRFNLVSDKIGRIETKLQTCAYYHLWSYLNHIWDMFGFKDHIDAIRQNSEFLTQDRTIRGIGFEDSHSLQSGQVALDILKPHITKSGLNLCIKEEYTKYTTPLINIPYDPIYNNVPIDNTTTFSFHRNCEWRRRSMDTVVAGEIDVIIIATTPVDKKISLSDIPIELNPTIVDGEIYVRQILAIIEMKSNVSDLSYGFHQHESKVYDTDTYIIDPLDKSMYFFYRSGPSKPPVFVVTRLDRNSNVSGLPSDIIRCIGKRLFDQHQNTNVDECISNLLTHIRSTYTYYVPVLDVIDSAKHKIIVF